MKKIAWGFLLGLMAMTSAFAVPVGPMNYQGRLLNDQGIPVTGSYDFVVRIFNAPTNGVLKYQEQHDGVQVDDGVYSFKVGTGTNPGGDSQWDINLWQLNLNNLYMEIVVNGQTLAPRHQLTSAPHAYTATLASAAEKLGAKTAAEYDNILEGICAASKGKWLTKEEKCLGMQSVFTEAKSIADLMLDAGDLDFSHLDLTNADIRGIDFTGANFTGTIFDGAKVDLSKFGGTNLSNTHWENTQNVGGNLSGAVNLTNAWMKNVSGLNGSNFSSATATGLSAAFLPACPGTVGVVGSNLPANWKCLEQSPAASGQYFLVGPFANLSARSALAVDNFGTITLPIPYGALDGSAGNLTNLQGVNFSGVDFFQASLKYANLQNAVFDYGELKYTNLLGSDLTGASLVRTDMQGAVIPGGLGYNNQNLSGLTIEVGENETYILTGSTLTNSQIIIDTGGTFELSFGTLNDVTITTKDGAADTATIDIQNSSILSSSIAVKNIHLSDTEVYDSTVYPDTGTSTAELIAANVNFYGGRMDVVKMNINNAGLFNNILFRFEGTNANATLSGLTTVQGNALLYVAAVSAPLNNIACDGGRIYMTAMNIINSVLQNDCELTYSGTASISSSTLTNMGETDNLSAYFLGGPRENQNVPPIQGTPFGFIPKINFDYVTFEGSINFGYAQGSGATIQITNSVFVPGTVVEMNSKHPFVSNGMNFYIQNTNFLNGVEIYGANTLSQDYSKTGYVTSFNDGVLIFVGNYFENTFFNAHMDSAGAGTHGIHVFDGNKFHSGEFVGAMGHMILNNNMLENINSPGQYHSNSSSSTGIGDGWYCPGVLDGSYAWPGYAPSGTNSLTSDFKGIIEYDMDCDAVCNGNNQCGVSVGAPPSGRGNPN